MKKIIAFTLFGLFFGISSAFSVGAAKDFFAHEKRKEKSAKQRLKAADKKTKARSRLLRNKIGAAERYISKRKKILKKKERRENLYNKRAEKRKKRQEIRLAKALKAAEKKRRRANRSPIPPDREYGIKVMPVKNPPKNKKTEIDPDFIY